MKHLLMLALCLGLVLASYTEAKETKMIATVRTDRATGPDVLLHAGAGTWINSGASKLTNGFGVGARVADTLPLYIGIDFAFNYIGDTPDLGFQILPTAKYRYETGVKQVIYPYVGLSAGLHLLPGNELFELLLRPGAEISLTRTFSLAVEGGFGVTDAYFSFLPALNAVFKI